MATVIEQEYFFTKMYIFVRIKSVRTSEGTSWVLDTFMTKFHAQKYDRLEVMEKNKKSAIFGNFRETVYLKPI